MKIFRNTLRPEKAQLIELLKSALPPGYRVRSFRFSLSDSIIVSRTINHAVQLTYRGTEEIIIDGTYASPFGAFLAMIDNTFGTGMFYLDLPTEWSEMENELIDILEKITAKGNTLR